MLTWWEDVIIGGWTKCQSRDNGYPMNRFRVSDVVDVKKDSLQHKCL